MEKEKLYELRYYANSLENGIDPTTGLFFAEDTIMNAPKIKDYNRELENCWIPLYGKWKIVESELIFVKFRFIFPRKRKVTLHIRINRCRSASSAMESMKL